MPTLGMQVQKYRQELRTHGFPGWKDEYPFDNLYMLHLCHQKKSLRS